MSIELSVCIPAFNKADALGNNLLSLMNQTFPHDRFEALICDDGSTDETHEVVQEAKQHCDFRIRYFYLNRPERSTAALPWNYCIRRAEAPVIVQAGADVILAKDALELLAMYVADTDGNTQVFGQAYNIHSPLAQALLEHVPWLDDIHSLESILVSSYHHSAYWTVPMLAALPKTCFERLGGYDESFKGRYPDDSWFWVRFQASGGNALNPPEVWGAHQWHVQVDPPCGENCPCPLWQKGRTFPGPTMKFNGDPKDLIVNPDGWGEFADSEER